jgi:hypothetical protein
VEPRFVRSAPSGNVRRQRIYDADLAAWEKEMNKKANSHVQDIIWNTAASKALSLLVLTVLDDFLTFSHATELWKFLIN